MFTIYLMNTFFYSPCIYMYVRASNVVTKFDKKNNRNRNRTTTRLTQLRHVRATILTDRQNALSYADGINFVFIWREIKAK